MSNIKLFNLKCLSYDISKLNVLRPPVNFPYLYMRNNTSEIVLSDIIKYEFHFF